MSARVDSPAGVAPRPERWTRLVHLVPLAVLLVYVAMGLRPGGRAGILLYRFGPTAGGLLAALTLAWALGWSLYRRPALQPGRILAFISLGAALWMASFPLAYPSSHDGHPSAVAFRLPVEGEWRVRWGGEDRRSNALVLDPSKRHGFHLVRVGQGAAGVEDTEPSRGGRVLAPAAGEVVGVERDSESTLGAYLVLRVAPGEFLFLGGLEPGSIGVAVGDVVAAGAPLARVGGASRSRLSPGPHLSIHLQDAPELGRGEAIPFRFHDLLVDGRRVEEAVPGGGLSAGRHVGRRVQAVHEPAGTGSSPGGGTAGEASPGDS